MSNKPNPYQSPRSKIETGLSFSLESLPVVFEPSRFMAIFLGVLATFWLALAVAQGCGLIAINLPNFPDLPIAMGMFINISQAFSCLGSFWLARNLARSSRVQTRIDLHGIQVRRLRTKDFSWPEIADWKHKSDRATILSLSDGKKITIVLSKERTQFLRDALNTLAKKTGPHSNTNQTPEPAFSGKENHA